MTDRLRVGVVGVGSMGRNHVRVYDSMKDVTLVGVADADRALAAEVAVEYDTDTYAVADLLDRVDAVSVVVPTTYHYEVASQCIDAGVDVLVEKPFVADPEQGYDLIERADDAGVTIQVGHVERFNPAVQALSDIVPDLDVIAIESRRLGPPIDRDLGDSVVLDLMIHDIDVALSLVDSAVAHIGSVSTRDAQYATATLQFADDTVATLTASRLTQRKVRTLEITATDCLVRVDYLDQSVNIHRRSVPEYVRDEGAVRYRHESVVEQPMIQNGEPLRAELAAFVDAVTNDTQPVVTAEEALAALELALEIDRQARQSEVVA